MQEAQTEVQLVTAGQEHAVTPLDVFEILAAIAVLAGIERQHLGMLDAEISEQLFVVAARLLEFRCGRNDPYSGLLAATDGHEAVQDLRVVEFLFGAADRDDESPVELGIFVGWAHGIESCSEGPKKAGIVHDTPDKLCPE
jgi:hypothetical protein